VIVSVSSAWNAKTTAVGNARFLRDRYTFLDLAGDMRHRASPN